MEAQLNLLEIWWICPEFSALCNAASENKNSSLFNPFYTNYHWSTLLGAITLNLHHYHNILPED